MSDRLNTEQILDSFAAEPSHSRETLEEYLAQYPHLRIELLELAAEIRIVSDASQNAPERIEDQGLDDAWDQFASTVEASEKESTLDPFTEFTRQRFAQLCSGLGLPRGFVVAIRDRRVQLDSIPERFLVATASLLETSVEGLRTYLRGTPRIIATAEFKANKRPNAVEQITFLQLIENTELTEAQRETALEYFGDDRPD